jgi:hypothetical protein
MNHTPVVIGAKCVMVIRHEEYGMAHQRKGEPWCIVVGESREDCQQKYEAMFGRTADEARAHWNVIDYWEAES